MSKKTCSYYIKAAEKNGLKVTEGGCHTKIYGPADRGFMAVPRHKDLSPGVEKAIVRWFLKLGIVVALGLVVATLIGAL